MIPTNLPSYATTWGFTNPANRNANLDYCQIGTLSGITYPTGGVTTFVTVCTSHKPYDFSWPPSRQFGPQLIQHIVLWQHHGTSTDSKRKTKHRAGPTQTTERACVV